MVRSMTNICRNAHMAYRSPPQRYITRRPCVVSTTKRYVWCKCILLKDSLSCIIIRRVVQFLRAGLASLPFMSHLPMHPFELPQGKGRGGCVHPQSSSRYPDCSGPGPLHSHQSHFIRLACHIHSEVYSASTRLESPLTIMTPLYCCCPVSCPMLPQRLAKQ